MIFLLGWRYPVVSLIIGAALIVAGVAVGKIVFIAVGCVGVVYGGYRSIAALRRRRITGAGRGLIGDGSRGRLR
jgi:hypothetical protein